MQQISGNIGEIMSDYAFPIHGLKFSNKEIIQCALHCSRSMYQVLSTEEGYDVDGLIITISSKLGTILLTPIKCKTPSKFSPFCNKNKFKNENFNTYTIFDENLGVSMLLSKGYLIDNFEITECYHDFLLNEEESSVYITAQDFESLTVPNPEII